MYKHPHWLNFWRLSDHQLLCTSDCKSLDGNDTTTHSHHPYILCHFANYAQQKLFTHSLNEHGTQHCSLHSLPHKRQSTSATFISNKISQQLKLPTFHTIHHWSQLLHKSRLYLPCLVATTLQPPTTQHTPCTSTCTTHSNTLPTTFLNPPMHTTNKHKT